jgi:hypothetical protein
MESTKAVAGMRGGSRSTKTTICAERRLTARNSIIGQFVALQSARDPDRSWWLACVTKEASRSTKNENKGGFEIKKGCYYLQVQHYNNVPGARDDDVWKKSREPPTLINAEGVIHAFNAGDFVVNRARAKAYETSRDIRFAVKRLAEEYAAAFISD